MEAQKETRILEHVRLHRQLHNIPMTVCIEGNEIDVRFAYKCKPWVNGFNAIIDEYDGGLLEYLTRIVDPIIPVTLQLRADDSETIAWAEEESVDYQIVDQ